MAAANYVLQSTKRRTSTGACGNGRECKKAGLDQQALAYLQKAQPSTSKEALRKIKQPVLIICGDKDSDNGSAKELADLFKHPVYRVTPGDHGSASRTKEFSLQVISFLHK
jgi:pimeloyl-ACP methyl ester carboxylesterase